MVRLNLHNKKKLTFRLIPVICFLLIWGFSLARCEILTLLHGEEFADAYKENTMLGEQEYWKILDYSETHARVYYVSKNYQDADILSFKQENGKWKYDKWEDTVWSKSGSASEVIWPYWWHFIYGGF